MADDGTQMVASEAQRMGAVSRLRGVVAARFDPDEWALTSLKVLISLALQLPIAWVLYEAATWSEYLADVAGGFAVVMAMYVWFGSRRAP